MDQLLESKILTAEIQETITSNSSLRVLRSMIVGKGGEKKESDQQHKTALPTNLKDVDTPGNFHCFSLLLSCLIGVLGNLRDVVYSSFLALWKSIRCI